MDEHLLNVDVWLEVLRRDYLASFINHGGSSVKVVVASSTDQVAAREHLASIATSGGFCYAHVDAATRRVHLVHTIMSEIARQIPWMEVASRFMRQALQEESFCVPDSGDLSIDALAEANNEAREPLVQAMRRIVTNRVFRDYTLSREFRLAAFALCRAVSDQSADIQQEAHDVIAWLAGELPRLSALRRLNIFRKIGRANARQIFYSVATWLRSAGYSGLVVTLDISRYALGKDADLDGNTYSKGASLDMHEVLRQFIDSTDEMTAALLIFQTGERFLMSDDRGLRNYDALRLRLTDDVRDRRRPNPLAPMVRLRATS